MNRPELPFRTIRHDGTMMYYATAEGRDAYGQVWADRDGRPVILELWSEDHDQGPLNLGWASDGIRRPRVATVTLAIANHYPTETIHTEVTTTIPVPPDLETDAYDDWRYDHLYLHTGTGPGRENDDAGYEVTVKASTVPELVGKTFEFGY